MQLDPNHLLQGDKYRIIKVLGQGGFGITYLAEQVLMERKVCIKEFFMKNYCARNKSTSQVSPSTSNNRAMMEMYQEKFRKEATMIGRLEHPNIVHILEVFKENNTWYYVMDFIEGKNLNDLVKERGALPESEALNYIRQVGEGLVYVHEHKINHLDIKPGNIMLRKDGRPVLIDFGMSKQYDESGDQTSSTPIGVSAGYAPFEMYNEGGVRSFSPQTDIYELAATLYHLVTGTIPPTASDILNDGLPERPESVSLPIWQAIEEAMAVRKNDRPNTMEAFLGMLPEVSIPAKKDTKKPRKSASRAIKDKSVSQPVVDDGETTILVESPSKRETDETVLVMEKPKAPRQDYLKYCDDYKEIPDFITKETVDKLQPLLEEASRDGDVYATLLLSELFNEIGKSQEGLALLDSLGKVENQEFARWAQFYRASCLSNLGKEKEAKELLESLKGKKNLPSDRFNELVRLHLCSLNISDTARQRSTAIKALDSLGSSQFSDIADTSRILQALLVLADKPDDALQKLKSITGKYKLLATPVMALIQIEKGDFKSAPKSIVSSIDRLEQYCNVQDWNWVYGIAGDLFINEDFKGHDAVKAYQYYLKGANASHTGCMTSIGMMLMMGNGCRKSISQAVKWFRKSAELGDSDAQNGLGELYFSGQGVIQDYAEAAEWYRRSAEQGNVQAQNNLGELYFGGRGVSQDYTEAFGWFRKSADQGDADAQNNLGYCYYNGLGVKQDYAEAFKWYRKSAEQGNADAQNNLGVCYLGGFGVSQDYVKAVIWFRNSAEQGNAEGQNYLGVRYQLGQGVKKNLTEAVKWYRKSADQGDADAQNNLGYCYYSGQGVKQDYAEAFKWHRKSAEQGNADAQNSIGDLYYLGQGVKQDYAEAVKWYCQSAEQGYAEAYCNIGVCYLNGQGVVQDFAKAAEWFEKAKSEGEGDVDDYLNKAIRLRDKKPWYEVGPLEYDTSEDMRFVSFAIPVEMFNVSKLQIKTAILHNDGMPVYLYPTKNKIPFEKSAYLTKKKDTAAVHYVMFDFDESELVPSDDPVYFILEVTLMNANKGGSSIVKRYSFSISGRSRIFRHSQWYNLQLLSEE